MRAPRFSAMGLLLLAPMLHAADRGGGELHVQDLTPKFLAFYAAASAPPVTEAQRWALWRKDYGIAAVPPTPQGLALARKQLDAVWTRYGKLLPTIGHREHGAEQDATRMLPRVKALLGASGQKTPVGLVLFVGQFDGNEFTVPSRAPGDGPTVVMPIETPNIRYALTQELISSRRQILIRPRGSLTETAARAWRAKPIARAGYWSATFSTMATPCPRWQGCPRAKCRDS